MDTVADIAPPHWQLDSLYAGIDSPEYLRDAAAADLAERFDIDIEEPAFWRESLSVVEGPVAAFGELTAGRGS